MIGSLALNIAEVVDLFFVDVADSELGKQYSENLGYGSSGRVSVIRDYINNEMGNK